MVQDNKQDLIDPGLGALDGAVGAATSSGNMVEWVMRSYFGRIKLNWDNKYLVEANFRADGSSRFLKGIVGDISLQLLQHGELVRNLLLKILQKK